MDDAGLSTSFNPRAPCGARPKSYHVALKVILFQSTRPVWGATPEVWSQITDDIVSIHAPRVGRDEVRQRLYKARAVSIHAPRVGRDRVLVTNDLSYQCFNPRAPCGARLKKFCTLRQTAVFQSTRPMRGATLLGKMRASFNLFQSTRPMRGATFDLFLYR